LVDPGDAHPMFYCSKADTKQPGFNPYGVPRRDK